MGPSFIDKVLQKSKLSVNFKYKSCSSSLLFLHVDSTDFLCWKTTLEISLLFFVALMIILVGDIDLGDMKKSYFASLISAKSYTLIWSPTWNSNLQLTCIIHFSIKFTDFGRKLWFFFWFFLIQNACVQAFTLFSSIDPRNPVWEASYGSEKQTIR